MLCDWSCIDCISELMLPKSVWERGREGKGGRGRERGGEERGMGKGEERGGGREREQLSDHIHLDDCL